MPIKRHQTNLNLGLHVLELCSAGLLECVQLLCVVHDRACLCFRQVLGLIEPFLGNQLRQLLQGLHTPR
jgi:hypothetical protein